MSGFRRGALVLFAFSLTVATIVPHVVLACDVCRYSPDHWGFCRSLPPGNFGWNFCREFIIDTFTGKTDCVLADDSCGLRTVGDSGGECWWTNLSGQCILAF